MLWLKPMLVFSFGQVEQNFTVLFCENNIPCSIRICSPEGVRMMKTQFLNGIMNRVRAEIRNIIKNRMKKRTRKQIRKHPRDEFRCNIF